MRLTSPDQVSSLCLHRLHLHSPAALRPTLGWLVALPPALISTAALGILLPSSGKYVEVLLEIILCLGLVKFVHLCRLFCGGDSNIVAFCQEEKILLPIGTPPLICLLPLKR